MTCIEKIGTRLREARKKSGLTQESIKEIGSSTKMRQTPRIGATGGNPSYTKIAQLRF
ncbi:MAG: hypothetical protein GY757_56990 [bacterium]|nr:hypothetical protein [bacterium]